MEDEVIGRDIVDYGGDILLKYGWNILLVAVAITILWKGFEVVKSNVEKNGLGPFAFKSMGLVVLLPVVLVLGGANKLSPETLAAIIGTAAGYFFGVEKQI